MVREAAGGILPKNKGITKIVVVGDDENLVTKIRTLNLNGNPVTTVEGAEKLTAVDGVNFDTCKLDSIPRWIGELTVSPTVSMQNTNLTEVQFEGLENLKTLNVSNNQNLRTISTAKYLTTFRAMNCDLQSLPFDFFHHRLETVHISGNKGDKNMNEKVERR